MTGLFFGSFNPIHTGHLIIAEFMREHAKLDSVWFIVSPQNPFKKNSELAPASSRLHMVKLAIEGNKKFIASDIEFKLSTPSYTIHTLSTLKHQFPRREFSIIMGSDNLHSIHEWKDYEIILKNFPLLIYDRERFNQKKWKRYPNIQFFDTLLLNISSTVIRSWISEKKSVRYMVPEKVYRYIVSHRLYK